MAAEANICEAVTDSVGNNAEDVAYDKVVRNLKDKPNARVVVCFCEGMTIRGLLKATQRLGVEGQFLFIGRCVAPNPGFLFQPLMVLLLFAAMGGTCVRTW